MPYNLTITEDAQRQLRGLPVRQQRIVEDGVESRLAHMPEQLSKTVKLLRPNPFAQYELRLENLRVLYNVDNDRQEVTILSVGEKVGNQLIVEGREFRGHESSVAE